jgi:hypothetical protein
MAFFGPFYDHAGSPFFDHTFMVPPCKRVGMAGPFVIFVKVFGGSAWPARLLYLSKFWAGRHGRPVCYIYQSFGRVGMAGPFVIFVEVFGWGMPEI